MDNCRVLPKGEMAQEAQFRLLYTPSSFQDPFQLLHLKSTLYLHHYSTYCDNLRSLQHVSLLNGHYAVIGISNAPECFYQSQFDGVSNNCCGDLLSCVLGVPFRCLFSCLPQRCSSREIHFLDKLDLIEHLNNPLARTRRQLQSVIEEDFGTIEKNTRTFELEFESFIQKLASVSSQFDIAISSLISHASVVPVSICAAVQILRQHIYWINSALLPALMNTPGVVSLPVNDGAFAIQFQGVETKQKIVLYASQTILHNPLSFLQWYEHQKARTFFPIEGATSVSDQFISVNSSSHHWTLDCYRHCDWNHSY